MRRGLPDSNKLNLTSTLQKYGYIVTGDAMLFGLIETKRGITTVRFDLSMYLYFHFLIHDYVMLEEWNYEKSAFNMSLTLKGLWFIHCTTHVKTFSENYRFKYE